MAMKRSTMKTCLCQAGVGFWLGLGSTQAIRLVVLGCEPQTLLGQRMSRGRSPWRCLTMPRKYTSGPAYLKSEANMCLQNTGIAW